jgi:hypothetical protein
MSARPASYPINTPQINRSEREGDHSPPSSAEVKKEQSYVSLRLTASCRTSLCAAAQRYELLFGAEVKLRSF